MFTSAYWKALGENLVKVGAATLGGLMAADGFNLLTANWGDVFSATGLAVATAFLLSLAAGKVTTSNGPDFRSDKTEEELASAK